MMLVFFSSVELVLRIEISHSTGWNKRPGSILKLFPSISSEMITHSSSKSFQIELIETYNSGENGLMRMTQRTFQFQTMKKRSVEMSTSVTSFTYVSSEP